MDAPARTRSTRDRPAKPPLSEQAIVDAALAVARTEGMDAVTMRRVAAELDTGAASLYAYVRNRDQLLQAMLERVISVVEVAPPDPARWREQIYELLDRFRVALQAHPGLAAVVVGEPMGDSTPIGDSSLAGLEYLLGLLRAGGIPAQDAAWACDNLMMIVTATAVEADLRRAAGETTDLADIVERLRANFAGLPVDRYPLVVAHANELVTGDGDERFRFAIETFLDGLVARSGRG